MFAPNKLINSIDNYFLTTYSLEFSELRNEGTLLNPSLKFYDFSLTNHDKSFFISKELELGLFFQPLNLFQPLGINTLKIKDGNLKSFDTFTKSSLHGNFINLNKEISLSFQNFKVKNSFSSIEINGEIFGDINRSLSGQLNFNHQDNLSTIAVEIDNGSYRFALNLHSFEWFGLVPNFSLSFTDNLTFSLNAIGEITREKSNIQGSFNSESFNFNSLKIKKNKGSFNFQSQKKIGIIKLTEFLNPITDEEHPVQINFEEKTIQIPKLFFSPQSFQLDKYSFSNLVIENLFLSLSKNTPQYSGSIIDLDLNKLYFEEILNLSGNFSGYGADIKFLIDSKNSLLRNNDGAFIPISIFGNGNYKPSGIKVDLQILHEVSKIDLIIQNNQEIENQISFELFGSNLSKELINFSIANSFAEINNYLNESLEIGNKNSFYLKYLPSYKTSQSVFNAKILSNDSRIILNQEVDMYFQDLLIEINNNNIFLFAPTGMLNNFTYNNLYSNLNLKNEKVSFITSHHINSQINTISLGNSQERLKLPSMMAINKGNFDLKEFKLQNAISVQTNNFLLPVFETNDLKLKNGSIYIVNLERMYGVIPSVFMNQNIPIIINGSNILKNYNLNFFTNLNFEPGKHLPNIPYLKIDGSENFKINLSINKNAKTVLNINSDLKNLELKSPLKLLIKNKSLSLPTKIIIQDFSNPSIQIINQRIDINLRNFNEFTGYISLGKKLPEEFNYFKASTGLNVYIYSQSMTSEELSVLLKSNDQSGPVNLNKFAFSFDNVEFFENNFLNVSGLLNFKKSNTSGEIFGNELNLNFRTDKTGFTRLELTNSKISNLEFVNSKQNTFENVINSRLIIKNSSINKIKIKEFDAYIVNGNKEFSINNIKLDSNLISISPFNDQSNAYFSINKNVPLYKLKGNFLIKDSKKIPLIKDFADFSYFNGSINLQWKDLSTLSYIEGETDFILKDLFLNYSSSNTLAFNLLGVLNLRNILGKVANLDLSIDEFTSTQLSRVEGNFLFSEKKLRLSAPLFVETNTAKMKWMGQINKNYKNSLDELDLNLDLRIRFGENLPWYAAILGGLPAIAGSAVINEIFEEDINELTNYQYEVLGTISNPKLRRINLNKE
ncbi:MAG: hypothetical protein CMD68_05045 [Gammaproteobacteria bacterium]|nr:hypothetical protein [Gammaproteobacteria bacterium]